MGTRSHLASSAGKFETLGSNFSQETPLVATGVPILQFSEVFFFYAFMSFQRTEKRLLNCSMSTRSQSASSAGKFETQAQILAMRPKVCWRPNTTVSEVFFLYLYR